MIGALLLVAVISLAVSIAGVTILSSVNTSQVPAVTFSLANESKNVTIVHTGGDPLPAGSYRIYVDGKDQTVSFSPTPSATPFQTGTTLRYAGDSLPRDVMVVSLGADGRETMLVQKFFS